MAKVQDKEAEMVVGSGTPEDEWLDDTQGYRVRKAHLELLGLALLHGRKILDAGCGPGTYGIMLAQAGNEVVAIRMSIDPRQRTPALAAIVAAKDSGLGHARIENVSRRVELPDLIDMASPH